jgi:hypothetical protein
MYNMVFGTNSLSETLLKILDIEPDHIPRFRDCYYDTEKELICIHTRTGGGNRDFYENEATCRDNFPDYFEVPNESDFPSGPWNDDLRGHELFQYDEDSDFDDTYANFYFKVPERYAEEFKYFPKGTTPEEKWDILFGSLNK